MPKDEAAGNCGDENTFLRYICFKDINHTSAKLVPFEECEIDEEFIEESLYLAECTIIYPKYGCKGIPN
jgi:hypothetical protein